MATKAEFQKNFTDFIEAVKIHLGFLKRDFGFSEGPPSYGGYECNIEFQSPDFSIDVGYELSSLPFYHFHSKTSGKWKSISVKKIIESLGTALTKTQINSLNSDLQRDMDASLIAIGKLLRLVLKNGNRVGV